MVSFDMKKRKLKNLRQPLLSKFGVSTIALWIGLDTLYGRAALSGILSYMKRNPGWSIPMNGIEPVNQSSETVSRLATGLIGQFYTEAEVSQALSFGIPVVNLTEGPSGCNLPTICLDNVAVGRTAAKHLVEVGCRFLYCLHDPKMGYSRKRWEGFQAFAMEEGLDVTAIPQDLSKPLAAIIDKRNFQEIARHLPSGSGVFGVNDTVVFGFMRHCVDIGRSIPSEIAVMGCNDDDVLCQLASPSITSIQVLGHDIGFKAAELLDTLIGRRLAELPHRQKVLPGRLISRESSDRLATLDPNLAQALRFIREHATQPIYASDVVEANKLRRRALENLFKQHVGHGIYEEIRLSHLRSVEDLLENSDLTIAQIATQTGFVTAPSLERAFMKKNACTASAWRQSNPKYINRIRCAK